MWNYDDYKTWLRNRLVEIKNTLDFGDFNIEVYNEQDYAQHSSINEKTITVVTKFLSSNNIFNVKTQPVQILVITEENSISVANAIMSKFCDDYNFTTTTSGTSYVKHSYASPVVLSNFNLIGIGYRTVLYINTNLFVLDNVIDIKTLTIDNNVVDPISATIGYSMSGDTQAFDGGLAKTTKNYATLVMTLNVACTESDFVVKCVGIMNGNSTYKGNEDFTVAFSLGEGTNKVDFNLTMKMTGATFSTAKNSVPSLQLSFSL